MNKIHKGDQVVVIAGKDKGRQGKVLKVTDGKVMVEGVNVVKRHTKPNPAKGKEGGVIVKTMPIAISNVAILNLKTKKADRVGIKVVTGEDNKVRRVRFYKSDGQTIGT
ncbi:MAG: 50S ribosomal protein L24 [Neisseriaceae bacterium]|nr:MAG: 50S ribosomal protein L24 [Neisseriaceae bacterium]